MGLTVDPAELAEISRELRAVASWGLTYVNNSHDAERYERILAASARLTAVYDDNRTPDEILEKYKTSYAELSPMAGGEAAVFQDGKILLIKRADDGLWAMQ